MMMTTASMKMNWTSSTRSLVRYASVYVVDDGRSLNVLRLIGKLAKVLIKQNVP